MCKGEHFSATDSVPWLLIMPSSSRRVRRRDVRSARRQVLVQHNLSSLRRLRVVTSCVATLPSHMVQPFARPTTVLPPPGRSTVNLPPPSPSLYSSYPSSFGTYTASRGGGTPLASYRGSDNIPPPPADWLVQPGAHAFRSPGFHDSFAAPTASSPIRAISTPGRNTDYSPANFDNGVFFGKGDRGRQLGFRGPPRLYDGDEWQGAKHNSNSAVLQEAGTAPQNGLRAFRTESSPFLIYQMNANQFPPSRYWR